MLTFCLVVSTVLEIFTGIGLLVYGTSSEKVHPAVRAWAIFGALVLFGLAAGLMTFGHAFNNPGPT